MSKTLMGQQDIPKYIKEMLAQLRHTGEYESDKCVAGYTFRLYGKHKIGYESQLRSEAEKLVKWAKRYYADSFIVKEHFWFDDVPHNGWGGDYAHQQKAYRTGYRNYITLVITDPVAKQLETAIENRKVAAI